MPSAREAKERPSPIKPCQCLIVFGFYNVPLCSNTPDKVSMMGTANSFYHFYKADNIHRQATFSRGRPDFSGDFALIILLGYHYLYLAKT